MGDGQGDIAAQQDSDTEPPPERQGQLKRAVQRQVAENLKSEIQQAVCATRPLATEELTEKAARHSPEKLDAMVQVIRSATSVDPQITYPSGASRSADVEGIRYDLLPSVALRRLAARYGLGAVRHGDRNWEGGMPASDTANHALDHFFRWLSGDRSEDHLAAVAWGAFALMFYEEKRPEMIDTPKPKDSE